MSIRDAQGSAARREKLARIKADFCSPWRSQLSVQRRLVSRPSILTLRRIAQSVCSKSGMRMGAINFQEPHFAAQVSTCCMCSLLKAIPKMHEI